MTHAPNAQERGGARLRDRSCPPAAGSHTTVLFRRYRKHGDAAARETLIHRYLPLARGLARRYARSSEPFEDLTQVAGLALVKAVERFDPERGSDFRAFAIPTILGELKRYFRDAAWATHVPRSVQERALKIEHASERLTLRNGRAPTVADIAGELGIGRDDVLEGLIAAQAYDTVSLNESRGSRGSPTSDADETTLGDTLGGEDERYELIEADVVIADALKSLPERERLMLNMRFVKDMTQAAIAAQLGVSQMQVSRLLRRSLDQLRTIAAGDGAGRLAREAPRRSRRAVSR